MGKSTQHRLRPPWPLAKLRALQGLDDDLDVGGKLEIDHAGDHEVCPVLEGMIVPTCAGIAPAAITGRVAITDDEQAKSYIELLDPDSRLRDAVRKGARIRRPETAARRSARVRGRTGEAEKAEAGSGTGRFCSLKAP